MFTLGCHGSEMVGTAMVSVGRLAAVAALHLAWEELEAEICYEVDFSRASMFLHMLMLPVFQGLGLDI